MAQQDRIVGLIGSLGMKAPCRAATSVDCTLSGVQTIDGVSLASGDRVLVKAQADPVENGIYIVGTAAWERAADFDGVRDVLRGTTVPISEGTVHAITIWQLSSSGILIGTSELTFTQIIGSGGGGGLSASAFMQTVLDDVSAAFARQTLEAAALNGHPFENFSALSLSVSESLLLPGPSTINSSGWLGIGVEPLSPLHVIETDTSSAWDTSKIVRTTDHVGGNPSTVAAALAINSTVIAASTNKEYGVSATLDSYAASSYNIAGYFLGAKRSTGSVEAGVFEAKDHTASANPTGALNALVATIFANGTDGFATRVGLELVAGRVNTAGAVSQIYAGARISVTDADATGAYFMNGIILQDDMTTALKINNSGTYSTYGIWDTGNKPVGINLSATYSLAALRINAGEKIAFESTGTSVLRADATYPNIVGFEGCWVNFEQGWGVTSGATNIASSASGGAASALPALPSGYLKMRIDGTVYKMPYYN